ncbi:hypothetical protein DL96DRAFT_1469812 [Flagelloscypha sp. PMI_526]|nr:hypothetical protein DL96DRAFT_1469812 [Flagelloscypha sp. PMI_526]
MQEAKVVSKDIQDTLLSSAKKRNRRPGEIAYPAAHSSALLDVENWEHVFRRACLGNRLTLTPMLHEPERVLDLGCGSGLWVLEAAQEWPNALLWGYDYRKTQPPYLDFLCPPPSTVPRRIKWVHGNFLEGLPFQTEFFDLVRVTSIGLGVPEDEWQDLLEEIHRVMAPGATLEIIEEDLIFPCAPVPEPPNPRSNLPRLNLDFSATDTKPGLSPLPESPCSPEEECFLSSNSESTFDRDMDFSEMEYKRSSITFPPRAGHKAPPSTPMRTSVDGEELLNPLDHTRLQKAWEQMLSARFISPSPASVIPFYISTTFENILTHPPIEIEIPPNSSIGSAREHALRGKRASDESSRGSGDVYSEVVGKDTPFHASETAPGDPNVVPPPAVTSWAPLHLAQRVRSVMECRDAIWEAYASIYQSEQLELPPAIVRSPVTGFDFRKKSVLSTTYEAFENDWKNWENDMMDRISLRKHITANCNWTEPLTDQPDWRVWRANMDIRLGRAALLTNPNSEDNICRSIRSFIAKKSDTSAIDEGDVETPTRPDYPESVKRDRSSIVC